MIRRLYRCVRDFYIAKIKHGVRVSRKATVMESTLDTYSHIGDYCFVYQSSIGAFSTVGRNSVLRNVRLGKFCSISWNVTLGASPHNYTLISTHAFHYISSFGFVAGDVRKKVETILGHDVWIGAGAIVMPGVTIGDGAVVGAGAVVTKDVPPYAIAAGCPARVIRYRFDSNMISQISELQWWNWDVKKLRENLHLFKQPVTSLDLSRLKSS